MKLLVLRSKFTIFSGTPFQFLNRHTFTAMCNGLKAAFCFTNFCRSKRTSSTVEHFQQCSKTYNDMYSIMKMQILCCILYFKFQISYIY